MLSRTATARARVTLFCWRQEESVMTEQPPKHNSIAIERLQPTPSERRARVKAHVKAVLKRLKERLRQGS